jgi:hypothetical protein
MEKNKQKMMLATLSQCVADRDRAASNISFILEHGCNPIDENTTELKKEFEKITLAELTIEVIQRYYANHFPLPSANEHLDENIKKVENEINQIFKENNSQVVNEVKQTIEKKEESNNDNIT